VAAGEIKQLARPIVAMQSDPPTRRGDRQRELAAIAPFPIRMLDLGSSTSRRPILRSASPTIARFAVN
jgi:hypothetical protein